jgi:hypothetical protein
VPAQVLQREGWKSLLRLAVAALIVVVILADLLLQYLGIVQLCKGCGQKAVHQALLAAGSLGWGCFALAHLVALQRPSWRAPASALLALLIGVHLGLSSRALLMPEPCLTCLTCGGLATLLLATFPDRDLPSPWAAGALLSGLWIAGSLAAL